MRLFQQQFTMYTSLSELSALSDKHTTNYIGHGKSQGNIDSHHQSLYEQKLKKIYGNEMYKMYNTPVKGKFGYENINELSSISTQPSLTSSLSSCSIQDASFSKISENISCSRNFDASARKCNQNTQNFQTNSYTKLASKAKYDCNYPQVSAFNYKLEQLNILHKNSSFNKYINQQEETTTSNSNSDFKFEETNKKKVYSDKEYFKKVQQFGNGVDKLSDIYMKHLKKLNLELTKQKTFDDILGIFPSKALEYKMRMRMRR